MLCIELAALVDRPSGLVLSPHFYFLLFLLLYLLLFVCPLLVMGIHWGVGAQHHCCYLLLYYFAVIIFMFLFFIPMQACHFLPAHHLGGLLFYMHTLCIMLWAGVGILAASMLPLCSSCAGRDASPVIIIYLGFDIILLLFYYHMFCYFVGADHPVHVCMQHTTTSLL